MFHLREEDQNAGETPFYIETPKIMDGRFNRTGKTANTKSAGAEISSVLSALEFTKLSFQVVWLRQIIRRAELLVP